MLPSHEELMGEAEADAGEEGGSTKGYEIEYVSKSGRTRELNEE